MFFNQVKLFFDKIRAYLFIVLKYHNMSRKWLILSHTTTLSIPFPKIFYGDFYLRNSPNVLFMQVFTPLQCFSQMGFFAVPSAPPDIQNVPVSTPYNVSFQASALCIF